jgi:Beta-lactamase class C and other penicillin binding proteins
VLQAILKKPLVLPVGKDVFYSCPGFIVLGKVLESVERKTLDVLCEKYVLSPLEMHHTCYCPKDSNIACSNTNVDLTGIVNDNNARFMGGVSGNAGLFSSISDMSKFAVMLANRGEKVISKGLFTKAIECYTKGLSESRGLGFNLVDSRYGQTGELFGLYSYGHTGYTGTSVFVDRETDLTVVLLTNRTHFDLDYSVFQGYRAKIHNAIRGEFI